MWAQCDGCDTWWHLSCAGLQANAVARDDATWYCVACAIVHVGADVKHSLMDSAVKAPSQLKSRKFSCLLQFCKWTRTPIVKDTEQMRTSLIGYFNALKVSGADTASRGDL